jgi:hypothetical protein
VGSTSVNVLPAPVIAAGSVHSTPTHQCSQVLCVAVACTSNFQSIRPCARLMLFLLTLLNKVLRSEAITLLVWGFLTHDNCVCCKTEFTATLQRKSIRQHTDTVHPLGHHPAPTLEATAATTGRNGLETGVGATRAALATVTAGSGRYDSRACCSLQACQVAQSLQNGAGRTPVTPD